MRGIGGVQNTTLLSQRIAITVNAWRESLMSKSKFITPTPHQIVSTVRSAVSRQFLMMCSGISHSFPEAYCLTIHHPNEKGRAGVIGSCSPVLPLHRLDDPCAFGHRIPPSFRAL